MALKSKRDRIGPFTLDFDSVRLSWLDQLYLSGWLDLTGDLESLEEFEMQDFERRLVSMRFLVPYHGMMSIGRNLRRELRQELQLRNTTL
jgi:hypothetical protein